MNGEAMKWNEKRLKWKHQEIRENNKKCCKDKKKKKDQKPMHLRSTQIDGCVFVNYHFLNLFAYKFIEICLWH